MGFLGFILVVRATSYIASGTTDTVEGPVAGLGAAGDADVVVGGVRPP
jgi:hypothetical protein